MEIKETLDRIYYDIGKQRYDFELACLTKDGAKSKWKPYLEVQADEKFLSKANNRTILPIEDVIDIEQPEKFEPTLIRIKNVFKFYSTYRTGSKGYHIHLFFDRELSKEEKLTVINRFNGDRQKATTRTMIALENIPHWKTGVPKTLVEENFGFNSASEYDFTKTYFNFDVSSIKVEEALIVVEKNFPKMGFPTECCLSFACSMLIEDLANPLGLNLEGAPSSEKTTILSFFYGIENVSFKSDLFTPKSFVSHAANINEEELRDIDLLPKIKNKIFLVPELAPIFGKRKEDLIENLSILTRVFDGEGLETDSGARGHRAYTGEYLFVWLGATTPLPTHVWTVMGKLGQRFLFLKIPDKNKTNNDLKEVMTDRSFKKKIAECRGAIHTFIKNKFTTAGSLFSILWDKGKDEEEMKNWIVLLAKLLSSLRAPIEIYSNGNDQEEYQFKTPIKEEPERAISHLYDVARGHAVLYDRNYVTMDDARVVFEIALSSCPFERYKILELFIRADKFYLNSYEIAYLLNCSDRNARTIIKTMEILGLGTTNEIMQDYNNKGRPTKVFTLSEEYSNILIQFKTLRGTHTVKNTSENNIGSQTDNVSKSDFEKLDVQEEVVDNEIQLNCKQDSPSDEDLIAFVREKGQYDMNEFANKYGDDRMEKLLSNGDLIQIPQGILRVRQ